MKQKQLKRRQKNLRLIDRTLQIVNNVIESVYDEHEHDVIDKDILRDAFDLGMMIRSQIKTPLTDEEIDDVIFELKISYLGNVIAGLQNCGLLTMQDVDKYVNAMTSTSFCSERNDETVFDVHKRAMTFAVEKYDKILARVNRITFNEFCQCIHGYVYAHNQIINNSSTDKIEYACSLALCMLMTVVAKLGYIDFNNVNIEDMLRSQHIARA